MRIGGSDAAVAVRGEAAAMSAIQRLRRLSTRAWSMGNPDAQEQSIRRGMCGAADETCVKDRAQLQAEVKRLRRENLRLHERLHVDDCRTCWGSGSVAGFLLGTVKTCPACRGSGVRGR